MDICRGETARLQASRTGSWTAVTETIVEFGGTLKRIVDTDPIEKNSSDYRSPAQSHRPGSQNEVTGGIEN